MLIENSRTLAITRIYHQLLQIVTDSSDSLAPTRLRVYHWHIGREPHRHRHTTHTAHNTVDTTYNGWRNHSTWAIGFHLMDIVTQWIMDDRESWDTTTTNAQQAGELFKDLLDEQVEMSELSTYPLLMDLLDTSDIDWYALGCHALEAALA